MWWWRAYKPGYLDSLGVGYEALREVNQRLVLTSITPFGQTGPYSQYEGDELMCYAMSTIMSISGTSDREPLKHGGFQAQYEGGLNGAGATTMALFHQSMTGEGQHLDVCITECVASTMLATQSMYAYTGGVQARRPAVGTLFGNPMACADGWVIGQTGGGATWDTQVDFYGKEELRAPASPKQASASTTAQKWTPSWWRASRTGDAGSCSTRHRRTACSSAWCRPRRTWHPAPNWSRAASTAKSSTQ